MTDGERIQNWLNEYKKCQEQRNAYENLMIDLLASETSNPKAYEFIKAEIKERECRMRTLREKIMIYGDY